MFQNNDKLQTVDREQVSKLVFYAKCGYIRARVFERKNALLIPGVIPSQ